YGSLGFSHHATEDLAILRSLPNMTVVAPGDDWEAEEATTALWERPGTCYLRLDRASAGSTKMPGERFALGRARRLRDGGAAALVATGGFLGGALAAADLLRGEHAIECRVESFHTIKPVDAAAVIAAATETPCVITLEEHAKEGGLSAAVLEVCADAG